MGHSQRLKHYGMYQTYQAPSRGQIKIKVSKESAVNYFSQYQQHDVVVQGIVHIFMDIAAGFPSNFHDRAEQEDVLAAPIHVTVGHQKSPYLVGDSSYPLSSWLQTETLP